MTKGHRDRTMHGRRGLAVPAPRHNRKALTMPKARPDRWPDYRWAERDDWQEAWEPLVAAVGDDLIGGAVLQGADDIERSVIRRYLEPLEFDCPLHYDDDVARAHGYSSIIAPYSGLATWVSIGVWLPGDEPVWTSNGRNDRPRPRVERFVRPGPDTDSMMATDIEYEFHHPFLLGARLSTRGRRLLAATPKETSVGRGAFMTVESEVIDQAGVVVATQRMGVYEYVARESH